MIDLVGNPLLYGIDTFHYTASQLSKHSSYPSKQFRFQSTFPLLPSVIFTGGVYAFFQLQPIRPMFRFNTFPMIATLSFLLFLYEFNPNQSNNFQYFLSNVFVFLLHKIIRGFIGIRILLFDPEKMLLGNVTNKC